MRTGSIICLIIFIFGAFLALIQLWFSPIDSAIFSKLIVTLGVIFVVVLGITLVRNEYISNKEMKDDGFID